MASGAGAGIWKQFMNIQNSNTLCFHWKSSNICRHRDNILGSIASNLSSGVPDVDNTIRSPSGLRLFNAKVKTLPFPFDRWNRAVCYL